MIDGAPFNADYSNVCRTMKKASGNNRLNKSLETNSFF
jgi:hypothetical protein